MSAAGTGLHGHSKVNPQDYVHPYLILQVQLQGSPGGPAPGKTPVLSAKNAPPSSTVRPSLSPSSNADFPPELPSPNAPGAQRAGDGLSTNFFHASHHPLAPSASQYSATQTQPADYINIEITFRDKQNARKRIVFSEDPAFATTGMNGSMASRASVDSPSDTAECVVPIKDVI